MRAVASHGLCLWGYEEVCDAMPATLIHRHRSHLPCSPPCRLVLRLPWTTARELAPRCQRGTRCLRLKERCATRESIGKVPAKALGKYPPTTLRQTTAPTQRHSSVHTRRPENVLSMSVVGRRGAEKSMHASSHWRQIRQGVDRSPSLPCPPPTGARPEV